MSPQINPVVRALGLLVCLVAIVWPAYTIYDIFANPRPGSEFLIFAIPFFAAPIILGLLGFRKLLQPAASDLARPDLSAIPAPATPPKGFQVFNGLVYAVVAVIVLICLWIGYTYYIFRSSSGDDTQSVRVSLEQAVETIESCTHIDIVQAKTSDPSKGIVFRPIEGDHLVYDDSAWPKLVMAAKKVSGSNLGHQGANCPTAKITPR